jgi:N-methylhydantoinase A/oxoprolinase/acetone carboxylase beta subunit
VTQAAHGIHRVVNAQMAEGMRLVSIRQGFDPRNFALVALGGAGPVHAVPLAVELAIETIVVPRHPGVLSAAGLLSAPIEHEIAMGFPNDLDDTTVEALGSAFTELDTRCARLMDAEEVVAGKVRVTHAADVCYVGQSHYLQVEVNLDAPDPIADLYRRFIESHEQVFGYGTASPARLVNLRSMHRARGSDAAALPSVAAGATAEPKGERPVILRDPAAPQRVPVLDRTALGAGQRLDGPLIIEQPDTTTVIHAGWCARVHNGGHLLLTRNGAGC